MVSPKSDHIILSGGCESSGVLPLPAPAKQTHCAESDGEERERRGERRCGYLGENSKGWPCPFGGKYAGMHYEGDDFDLNQ